MNPKKKLQSRLFLSFFLIVLFTLLAVGGCFYSVLKDFYHTNQSNDLRARALLMENLVRGPLDRGDLNELRLLTNATGLKIKTRFTIIDPVGLVLSDSEEDPTRMENHAGRPEIQDALRTGSGTSVRYSKTRRTSMMYTAVKLDLADKAYIIRASMPVTELTKRLGSAVSNFIVGLFAIAMLAVGLSYLIARRINSPIQKMKLGAQRFAKGDLDYRLDIPDQEETGALAVAMNDMAAQLQERIKTIELQKSESNAILSGMMEAVFVLDMEKKIVQVNRAACELFDLAPESTGILFHHKIRNADLLRLLDDLFSLDIPQSADATLGLNPPRFVQAHATFIQGLHGKPVGALLVLHDLTQLKKLEGVRRDFVANVSHELKTPITSIKGFAETLKDGALNDPENANRFISIIADQANRLIAIVNDLLMLSRIEAEEDSRKGVQAAPVDVSALIGSVVNLCRPQADSKNIALTVKDGGGFEVHLDSQLMERALINLLENGVKYSPENSEITVGFKIKEQLLTIEIADQGVGIAPEHLSRIFERFYRVDKARSREMGGTGLGLAIVKHIVALHNGVVKVESELGKGSTFTIEIPA